MGIVHIVGSVERKISLLVGDVRRRFQQQSGQYSRLHDPESTSTAAASTTSNSLISRVTSHPKRTFTLVFAIFYAIALLHFRSRGYNDPTSFFYSTEHGNDKHYSLIRDAESEAFLLAANDTSNTTPIPKAGPAPDICLAVATVKRPGEQYIRHTVASLLDGLSTADRARLHFLFFIAHVDQTVHAINDEPWTRALPDTFLRYQDSVADDAQLQQIQEWEDNHDYIKKGLFDYGHLLRACVDASNAPYIAMVEGDVLAAKGWFPLALRAANYVDDVSFASSVINDPESSGSASPSWLYLRLFYTEAYFGWNSEFWASYLGSSIGVAVLLSGTLLLVRTLCFGGSSTAASSLLSNSSILALTFVFLPLTIILYFAAGRATVRPLPVGPQRMDNYGCCSQGFIFKREQVPLVLNKLEHAKRPYADMLMELTAEEGGLERWAIVPSLLQHVGGKSSKGDEVADRNAKKIWNFGFEQYGKEGLVGGQAGW